MKSELPKVLCEVLFQPMIRWVEDACRAAGVSEIAVVTGNGGELVEQAAAGECRYFRQEQRLGTGHAVMMAREMFAGGGDCLVLYGDMPLVNAALIEQAYETHTARQNAVTVVTARLADPTGYGRILRDGDYVTGIVEQKDATEAQKKINEINAGLYWFDAAFLNRALDRLTCENAQGEYYLTDLLGIAVADGERAGAHLCPDSDVILGANDRRALSALNHVARSRLLDAHRMNGVDIPFDDGIVIGSRVQIGQDTRILPGSILLGNTVVGCGCEIGPQSRLENVTIGDKSRILSSWLTDSTVGAQTTVGPFSQLRPNSRIGDRVKIGDFVEIKNASIGDKTSIAHLTYIGDSDVGKQCNFGCGVVTANYDGKKKFRTVVGDRAFIGCNTNLVPPVTVGEGAYTAAGTTIDRDVPPGALAIGRVKAQIKEGWADENIGFQKNGK